MSAVYTVSSARTGGVARSFSIAPRSTKSYRRQDERDAADDAHRREDGQVGAAVAAKGDDG